MSNSQQESSSVGQLTQEVAKKTPEEKAASPITLLEIACLFFSTAGVGIVTFFPTCLGSWVGFEYLIQYLDLQGYVEHLTFSFYLANGFSGLLAIVAMFFTLRSVWRFLKRRRLNRAARKTT